MAQSSRIPRLRLVETPSSAPQYELRIRYRGVGKSELEIWQMPAVATPHLRVPARVAGLAGEALELVEHRIFKQMQRAGLRVNSLQPTLRAVHAKDGGKEAAKSSPVGREAVSSFGTRAYVITEDLALNIGLLCRVLAPMRNRTKMRAIAEGIEAMHREEAGYWLSMAMHRKNPRRVLTALRYLLTDPTQK
jgi:hypothetical protein